MPRLIDRPGSDPVDRSNGRDGLRVLVVGTLPPTVGGIARAIEDQMAALRARGVDVDALNTGRRRRRRPGAINLANAAAAAASAAEVFRRTRRTRPSVVAVHTVGSPAGPLLRSLALVVAVRAGGAPVVVHVHGYDVEEVSGRGGAAFSRGWRAMARLAVRVVVLHDAVARALQAVAPGAVIDVVPNGVGRPTEAESQPSSPADRARRIVFVGTVGRRKGVPELLAAVAELGPDVRLDLVGGAGEEGDAAYGEVVAAAADQVATGRVVLHGEVDRDQVHRALAVADVFALPSHGEGMPVALLEAMAMGVPCVVTDVGAMGTVVREAGCGVVVPVGDVGALTAALRSLLDDPVGRRHMGEAGRSHVARWHSIDAVGDRLAALYRDVAGGVR